MKMITLMLFSLLLSAPLWALEAPYSLPITRNGITQQMLAFNWWDGEYPRPVIHIHPDRKENGLRTISAYQSPRKLDQPVFCSIRPGIYHPWSKDQTSLINFYTLAPWAEYEVLRPVRLADDLDLTPQDRVIAEAYLAENICAYVIKRNGKQVVREDSCELFKDRTHFRPIEHRYHPSEQWLYLKCTNGSKAFVEVKHLLGQPGVGEGRILGYGQVGP